MSRKVTKEIICDLCGYKTDYESGEYGVMPATLYMDDSQWSFDLCWACFRSKVSTIKRLCIKIGFGRKNILDALQK